jgi:hypothetical protein
MSLGFCSHASRTRLNVFLDEFTESRPSVIATDEVDGLALTRMSGHIEKAHCMDTMVM